MDEVRIIALEWMANAKRDLEAARRMIDCADPLLDTGAYHCQQAADIALRAAEKIVERISEKPPNNLLMNFFEQLSWLKRWDCFYLKTLHSIDKNVSQAAEILLA